MFKLICSHNLALTSSFEGRVTGYQAIFYVGVKRQIKPHLLPSYRCPTLYPLNYSYDQVLCDYVILVMIII